jgi:hypothetical protein
MAMSLKWRFDELASEVTPNEAIKLFDANHWADVVIDPEEILDGDDDDQYLEGGAFTQALYSTNPLWKWWVYFIAGNGNTAPFTATYGGPSIDTVTGPDGNDTKALTFTIKRGDTVNPTPQIRLTDMQSTGLPGGGRVEPVMYFRTWVKFDENTLTRAQRVGASDFYQIFFEIKAHPDFRFRCQLQYKTGGLYWVCHDDVLTNADRIHNGECDTVPVVLAASNSPLGWHKFETWFDRPNGRWKATIDGVTIIDLDFGPGDDLYGTSGNIMDFIMFCQAYSTVSTDDIHTAGDGPLIIRWKNFEVWDSPPADAWTA